VTVLTKPAGTSKAGAADKPGMVSLAGIELELIDRGSGSPLLYLHGGSGIAIDLPFLELLGRDQRLIAPSHPGFGKSSLPDWLDSIDDIAHIYLELMDRLDLARADVVGFSIGGWIAADLASKAPERIARLVLIGPVGVKTGPSDRLDIPDVFAMPRQQLDRLRFHDPAKNPVDFAAMSDDELHIAARNSETLALLTWEPYMHDPKLKHRLHRARVPALFVRGESDGIVSAEYLARYAALMPQARIVTIAAAGHLPHVEQPQATLARVQEFLQDRVASGERSGARS
jgi:pimeloyl-ACP methyl ester carboxylesterase